VVADNWGGLFEPIPLPMVRVYRQAAFISSPSLPKKEQLAVDAHIVVDNWSREFEELARVIQERDYKQDASDAASPLPVKE
jgi:hypothetical protein